LLANVESDSHKLMPLVLAGQPELAARLSDPSLRQLKQRIALRCFVDPLSLQETGAYVSARIRAAGGEAVRLFTREAVMLIHERSHGIPRTINVICDNALLTGMALGRRPVSKNVVFEVCRDFDLRQAGTPRSRPQQAPPAGPFSASGPATSVGEQRHGDQVDAGDPSVDQESGVDALRRVLRE